MPPDAVAGESTLPPAGLDPVWRRAAWQVALVWLTLIAVFFRDWLAMADQWWNSSTYNHILLVPVIVGWLVWQRRAEVVQLAPLGWRPGLVPFALSVAVWLLGAVSGFDLLRQAGTVAMLPASALILLGPKSGTALLFPFAYMVFLVPFGDEFVPALQTITAALTIALVRVSGIPARIEGVFIDTPAGLFEVAEACSGVKFLIAMIALGVLVAHVGFRSWNRRAVFMALCVVAPVVANGLRAFGTVLAAQYVGAERAGGIDHLIYGWIFFALVIAAVLAVSWRYFDRAIDAPFIDASAIAGSPWLTRLERFSLRPLVAGLAMAAVVVAGQGWARAADRLVAPLPTRISLPEVPGWHRIDYAPRFAWQPRAAGSDHHLLGRYADQQGHEVDVFFALYATQSEGKEAGGFGEGALRPDSGWSWQGAGPALAEGRSERLLSAERTGRLAQTYYRTGDVLTGSNLRLKVATIANRIVLRRATTTTLILSAETRRGRLPEADLEAFRAAIGPIGPWMDRMASGR
ncbi:MAG: exosortase A [Novosphingobium sp.]|nr:exosortase A [Novosphingobium sp.]